jgi:uncharacterized protein YjiS (DUF1127 family)
VDARCDDPHALAIPGARSHARSSRLAWVVAEVRAVFRVWRQRSRYRRELARLRRSGPHLIDDIGLSQAEAEREAATPFWRPYGG